jgi:hypothetical protein
MVGAKITRLTSGNTAGRADRWCLTFDWVGNGKILSGSLLRGSLQSDGYGAYDYVGGPKIVHAACWAHARRKFFDAVKAGTYTIKPKYEIVFSPFEVQITNGA